MICIKTMTALLVALAAMGAGPTAIDSPVTTADDEFTLDLASGMPVDSFLDEYSRVTGRRVLWDQRRVGNRVISGTGSMTFPVATAEQVFGTILLMHDLAAVPFGDPALRFTLIEDIKTSQSLKQHASFVDVAELDSVSPAQIVAVVVPLKNLDCDRAQRALNNLIQEHRAGFVQPVSEANALLITNFAMTVKTMVQIVESMEKAALTESAQKYRARQAEKKVTKSR